MGTSCNNDEIQQLLFLMLSQLLANELVGIGKQGGHCKGHWKIRGGGGWVNTSMAVSER